MTSREDVDYGKLKTAFQKLDLALEYIKEIPDMKHVEFNIVIAMNQIKDSMKFMEQNSGE